VYDPSGKGDKSFNDKAFVGYELAQQSFGARTIGKEVTPPFGSNLTDVLHTESSRCRSIIAIGFTYAGAIMAVDSVFPSISYTIIDSQSSRENVRGAVFSVHEGTFLTGALAALKSLSGHIGFIGGFEISIINQFRAGFVAGAKYVNPNITVDIAFVNHPMWNDPVTAKALSLAMYEQGCDVIQQASGTSGMGVFEAARDFHASNGTKVWTVGVDADQYTQVDATLQPYILSSILKRVDTAVFDSYSLQTTTGSVVGGDHVYNLANNGVDYATSGGFTDEYTAQLTAYRDGIVAGTITVPATV
jgi:basic membrane protein A